MSVTFGAIVPIILFLIIHLVGTVWWMSKIQTTLSILNETVALIGRTLAKHESTYYSKEDMLREINRIDMQVEAIWKRIDALNQKGA